jgi:DNA-directed RNA polymerase beta' subunit
MKNTPQERIGIEYVCRVTGLSQKSVQRLRDFNEPTKDSSKFMREYRITPDKALYYTFVVDDLLSCDKFFVDTIKHIIDYLACVKKAKELNNEIERLSREIQHNSVEPDFSEDAHLQKLYECAIVGNELDEVIYRDELFLKTEKFFKKIENTAEYQEKDKLLTKMCERYAELHDEIEEVREDCDLYLHYAQKYFAKNIEQIAGGDYNGTN